MSAVLNLQNNSAVKPKKRRIYYPESDGKPMAETDAHLKQIFHLINALENFFLERNDVYVAGCNMFYYVEGEPQKCVSPDVYVCFGIPKGNRRVYKVWAEKNTVPAVIFEITSRKTAANDREEKKELYQRLGVREYYVYNPEDPKTLSAFRLDKNGRYEAATIENRRVHSPTLNLEIVETPEMLRLLDPATNEFLPTVTELAQKAEAAQAKAEAAKTKADAESKARAAAETEIERLKAELARLKQQ